MKVLFLDIDGVLNRFVMNAPQIEQRCVFNLTEVLRDTGCNTVLSSSWRNIIHRGEMNLEGFATMLRTHGLYGMNLIDTTCAEGQLPTRGQEIRRWLSDYRASHGVESYCILDDDNDHISELHGDRFVRTNSMNGLTMEDANRAIAILNEGVE